MQQNTEWLKCHAACKQVIVPIQCKTVRPSAGIDKPACQTKGAAAWFLFIMRMPALLQATFPYSSDGEPVHSVWQLLINGSKAHLQFREIYNTMKEDWGMTKGGLIAGCEYSFFTTGADAQIK